MTGSLLRDPGGWAKSPERMTPRPLARRFFGGALFGKCGAPYGKSNGISRPRSRRQPQNEESTPDSRRVVACALRGTKLCGVCVTGLRADSSLHQEPVPTAVSTGLPGADEVTRSVPFPAALAEELAALMIGKGRDDLVFTDLRGGVLRNSNWRGRVFRPAVTRCQDTDDTFPTMTPHDLRHTAASLAVSVRANVKAVQRMLGHAKASMTSTPTQTCSTKTSTKLRTAWTMPSELLRTLCGRRKFPSELHTP
jgi:hypothetical protein